MARFYFCGGCDNSTDFSYTATEGQPQNKIGGQKITMDYRKDVRTPRDRVDEALLRRLLSETDEEFGEICPDARMERRSGCSCRTRETRRERCAPNAVPCPMGRREDGEATEPCECINRGSMSIQTQGLPLVMSYAPDQEFHLLYEEEEALMNGTLFSELDLPFYPGKCSKNSSGNCSGMGSGRGGSSCGCE